ncbi:MAG: AMP-binding protein, partial [Comamonas sp.]
MTFDTLPPTVAHALAQTAARHAGAAYIEHGQSYSWPQVQTTVTVLARRLQALGIGRGDRIGIILPNCMAWIHTYLAAAQLGAV